MEFLSKNNIRIWKFWVKTILEYGNFEQKQYWNMVLLFDNGFV